jgi:hypothetical protein
MRRCGDAAMERERRLESGFEIGQEIWDGML